MRGMRALSNIFEECVSFLWFAFAFCCVARLLPKFGTSLYKVVHLLQGSNGYGTMRHREQPDTCRTQRLFLVAGYVGALRGPQT
jgi:hypothetical protein